MADETEEKSVETIKIPHHRGNDYSSHYATGMVLSGPASDGLYQMHFFIDTFGLNAETAQLVEGEQDVFKLSILKDDLMAFREDKARISVTAETLHGFRDIIDKHLAKNKGKEDSDA